MSSSFSRRYRQVGRLVRSNDRLDSANKSLSGLVFGNTAGVGNNVAGMGYRLYTRAQSNGLPSTGKRHEVQQLRRRGHLRLGNVLSDRDLASIQETYDRLVEDEETSVERGWFEGDVYSRTIRSSVTPDEFPELNDIITDEAAEILHEYFGAYFRPWLMQCTRNYHVPREVVSRTETFANYWHFDRHKTFDIKLFVLMSDVDEDDGPLHLVPLEDSKRLARGGFRRGEDGVADDVVKRQADMVKFTGSAGSAMLGTTHAMLHRAGNPGPGRRRDMIILRIFPATEPSPDNWLAHLQPNYMDRNDGPMYGDSDG